MSNSKDNGFLFADPKFFDVNYQINPYMTDEVDLAESWKQWGVTVSTFRQHSSNVQTVDYQTFPTERHPVTTLPDMVFSANHAMAIPNDGFILSNMRNKERQPEPTYFKKWARYNNYTIRSIDSFFEGEGDAKWDLNNDLLWLGYGVRTERGAVEEIDNIVDLPVRELELESEYYYHLDVCFEPLSEDDALYIPEAFSDASLDKLHSVFNNMIEVPESDKRTLGGNCALVDDTVIADRCNKETISRLRENGYDVETVDTGEFMKSGGSVDCLFLRIP